MTVISAPAGPTHELPGVRFTTLVGRNAGSRTIESFEPSIARWKVSARMRPPTPRI